MVSLTTKIINRYIDSIPRKDPIIISWIKNYLKSSYRVNGNYLHYNGEITHYRTSKEIIHLPHKLNRLLIYNNKNLIANIGIYNFKKYCRTILRKGLYEI